MEIHWEGDVLKVSFNPMEVRNKFLRHLDYVNNCIKHLFFASENQEFDHTKLLPTDNLPIIIQYEKEAGLDPKTQPERTIRWLFTKGIEELIHGVTDSLIEAYKISFILKFQLESLNQKPTKQITEQEKINLENKINLVIQKSLGEPFPNLINFIENETGLKLLFKDELETINQLRNCLVHRRGIVSKKKDAKSKNVLEIRGVCMNAITARDGNEIIVDYEMRKKTVIVDKIQEKRFVKSYPVDSTIILTMNDYNDFSYTCSIFVLELQAALQNQVNQRQEYLRKSGLDILTR